jgi:O-antigen/teichoic acid export membrane protein
LKILKDITSIGISDIITAGIGGGFWFYIAFLLEVEEYGEINFLISIASIGAAIAVLGTRNTIIVYEAKKIDLRKFLFVTALIGGLIVSLILFLIYQKFEIIILMFGLIVIELSLGLLLGGKLFQKYAKIIILQKSLMVLFGIVSYFLIGAEAILFGIGLSYFPFVYIFYKGFQKSEMNLPLFKKHSGFIINNYVLVIFGHIKGNADKIIIAPLIGFAALGNYALAFQVYLVLMIFSNIIYKYSLPHDAEKELSNKIRILTLLGSTVIALSGVFVAPILIPELFPKFEEAVRIIPILSLAIIPNTVILIFKSNFLGKEKSRYLLQGSVISVGSYLLLFFMLIPEFGILGIAISFLISSIISAMYYVIIYKYTCKN